MSTYSIVYDYANDILHVAFGNEVADNARLVKDVESIFKKDLKLSGGKIIKVNGASSIPLAFVIAHNIQHIFGVVAVYDPKLSKYVVVCTHSPTHSLGELID